MPDLAPVYLFAGDDAGKIDAMLARLRARAESEGGPGALESFGGDGAPDADALVGAIPAMSLTASRRFLLADGVERWSAVQAKPVAEALRALPPDLTIVFVAREGSPKPKAPKALVDAIAAAGGDIRRCDAPRARDLPSRLRAEAERRGFRLAPEAAGVLVERLGNSTLRLQTELDRLALWAGEGGEVTGEDLEAMVADTSEEVMWTLSDAIVDGDRATAAAAAARLTEQGETVTPLVYQMAKRLREARLAQAGLEAGRSPQELERSLPMHPYAAKLLLRRVRGASSTGLRAGTCAVADLEWWTRGGSGYPEDVALALAVARATRDGSG
jgi:DNA polymerase III subunit delta